MSSVQEKSGANRRKDITGQRFGKLLVLSMADDYISPSGVRLSRCNCLCDCGNTTIVNMSGLVTNKTRSCGCLANTCGLLKDNAELVRKYDFEKNDEIGLPFDKLTARSGRKAWWKCEKCGNSWFATIASQNDAIKHGCPYCSGRNVLVGINDLESQFPDIAKEWNYEKNGQITPNSISAKSSKKVWWRCEEGHEWEATVANRTFNQSGCPRCNIESVNSFCEQAVYYYVKKVFPDAINGDHHIETELDIFIPSLNTAIEYDGEPWHLSEKKKRLDEAKNTLCASSGIRLIRIREPRLSPMKNCVTINRTDSTTSKSLNKSIYDLLSLLQADLSIIGTIDTDADSGSILAQFSTKKLNNSLQYCFPEVAKEWHPTKNGNLTPDCVSKASSRKVWWLGKCGHEWQMIVSDRTKKEYVNKHGHHRKPYGCPFCSGKMLLPGFNDLLTRYPQIAEEWHPEKNLPLLPNEVMPGSQKRVWWLGKCGHEWQANVYSRTKGIGKCPYCSKTKTSPNDV